jgi:hypothetical protein
MMEPQDRKVSGPALTEVGHDRRLIRSLAVVSAGALVVAGGFGIVHATNHGPGGTAEAPGSTTRPAAVPAPPAQSGAGDGRDVRRTLPSVARNRAASPAAGLSVTLDGIRAIEADAQGPGMMAGPAVTVMVTVRNETGRQVRAPGGTMTVTYGPEDIPAELSQQPSDVPVPPSIEAGGTVQGTYTFLVPVDERNELTITFDYRASDPAVVFTGTADNGGAGR